MAFLAWKVTPSSFAVVPREPRCTAAEDVWRRGYDPSRSALHAAPAHTASIHSKTLCDQPVISGCRNGPDIASLTEMWPGNPSDGGIK